jgi:hypothetical protein
MRLLTDDPAFSWSGTLSIVIGFGIFGLLQTVPKAARMHRSGGWSVGAARVVGGIGMVPLFVAAGGFMLPTVLAGGAAYTRATWRWGWRAGAVAVAAVPFVLVIIDAVDESGWDARWMAGVALMVVTYVLIVRIASPTLSPQRYRRRPVAWLTGVGAIALVLASVFLTIGFAFGD